MQPAADKMSTRKDRLEEAIVLLTELAAEETRQCALLAEAHRFDSAVKCHKSALALTDTAQMLRYRIAS